MKKYTSVALLALLASAVANASENPVKDMSDEKSKQTCLNSVFGGRLESVTDSRSFWTMITHPQAAYFLQSPKDVYIQCLRENPKAQDLVTFKIDPWNTYQNYSIMSVIIGDTIIKGLDRWGQTAEFISQGGKTIDQKSICRAIKRETAQKLYLIYRWQEALKKEELEAQKEATIKAAAQDEDFLKRISTSDK